MNNHDYLISQLDLAIDNPSSEFIKFNLYVSKEFKQLLTTIQRYTTSNLSEIVLSPYTSKDIICPFTDDEIKRLHSESKSKTIDVVSAVGDGRQVINLFNSNLQQLNIIYRWWLGSDVITDEEFQSLSKDLVRLDKELSKLTEKIKKPKYIYNENSLLNRQAAKLEMNLKGCDRAIALRLPVNVDEALNKYLSIFGDKYRKTLKQQITLIRILQPSQAEVRSNQYESIKEQSNLVNKQVKYLNLDKLNDNLVATRVKPTGYLVKGVTEKIMKINKEV